MGYNANKDHREVMTMEEQIQQTQPNPRRRRKQLAPWERALRRYWPPIRLLFLGAIAISLVVLLVSCVISAFV
jgi:hypothetical protein